MKITYGGRRLGVVGRRRPGVDGVVHLKGEEYAQCVGEPVLDGVVHGEPHGGGRSAAQVPGLPNVVAKAKRV